jgi:CTP synthase
LDEQKKVVDKGATMRLGAYDCRLKKGSKVFLAYQGEKISERHRHRYEFNNSFRKPFENKGVIFAGINPRKDLVEIMELKDHPWFVACQFHPEFKSKPDNAHPLFAGFIKASLSHSKKY